jgi:hypothetical protein
MRRIVLALVVVAALAGAAAAGAITVGAIATTVRPGQWARLGTSEIYCQAITENAANSYRPAFECADWVGNHRRDNTYSAIIDRLGVEVDRLSGYGKKQKIRHVVTYLNP